MNKFYSLAKEGSTADIDIYGDITSCPCIESDVSSYNLSNQIEELGDVETINVNINSYGGEVSEGIAIYNALKRSNAHVVTRCDGFACSIASVIFSAGDERVMSEASILMVHNAMSSAFNANAADFRKLADDLDKVTTLSKAAYLANINITEDELTSLMDEETWILPQDALDMGFATVIEHFGDSGISQSARASVFRMIADAATSKDDDEDGDEDGEEGASGEDPSPESEPEPDVEDNPDAEDDTDPEDDPEEDSGGEDKPGKASEGATGSFFVAAFDAVRKERN